MTENFRPTVLRTKSREALKGSWNQGAIVSLVVLILTACIAGLGRISPFLQFPIQIFVLSFVSVGTWFVFLDFYNSRKALEIKNVFEPFNDYSRYLVGILLVFVYTLLWTLLLVIPGIIKQISYSMTYYIMRENPEMKGEEAIRKSMDMMEGHKMDYFLLQLSFIGWFILGCLSLGIGLLWVLPYQQTAIAAFYEELKKEYATRNTQAEAQPQVQAQPAE